MNHSITSAGVGSRAKLALLLLGGFAAITGFAAANAAPAQDGPPSVVVRYDQKTLGTDAGTDELYRRIVAAAKRVCPDESNRDLSAVSRVAACRQQAVARAIQQIGNPHLAAAHAGRSKNG